MKKTIIVFLFCIGSFVHAGFAQTARAFDVNIMIQTTVLFNITIPPAADAIKARYLISDGSEVIDYKNGTQIVLKSDDTIEKYSADRKTKQVFAFEGDKTKIVQFQKQRRRTIKTIFEEDENGNFIPLTSFAM